MTAPRVSVIVPAPRLNEYGRRCLERLLELEPPVEVVFVPDEVEEGVDPRVVQVPSGVAPVGRKRQLGLERARGEVVALIDDDAYPHRDWLVYATDALDADPDVAAVCGPTLTPPDDGELAQAGGRVFASLLVSGPARWRYVPVEARDVDDAPSVNLVLRREVALAVGLESRYHPGDDTDVCARILERGRRIRYVPGAVVYHSRRPLWQPHVDQVWRFGRHRGAFARMGGRNSLRPAYFAPSALLLGVVAGALLPGKWRRAWKAGLAAYGLACVAAGHDRDPARWARVATAIPLTHAVYGAGFLLGLAGVEPPRKSA